MHNAAMMMRKLSLLFSAGAIGGLANSIAVWLSGEAGLAAAAGVTLAPALTKAWLYPRIVWGGIWGLVFLVPLRTRSPLIRGLILSIAPTLVQLFVIFPQGGKGSMGLSLGTLTPLFVFVFNAVWGITAAYWLRATGER